MLYCREISGRFLNSLDCANCDSASSFESALETTAECATILSLIIYEDSGESNSSEAVFWFSAKLICTLLEGAGLLGHRSTNGKFYLNKTNPHAYLEDPLNDSICKQNIFEI
jgi:hypothetical protein